MMKRLFFWGRLLLGVLLIGFLLYTTDTSELGSAIQGASLLLLGVAYFIGIIDRILMAYKWNLLLRARAIVISLVDATVTYVMSTFLGLFLPATVGGDAIRSYAVSKFGYPVADAASTIVIERALGLLALMFMVLSSIMVGGVVIGGEYIADLWGVLLTVAAAGLVALILIGLSFNRNLTSLIGKYFRGDSGHGGSKQGDIDGTMDVPHVLARAGTTPMDYMSSPSSHATPADVNGVASDVEGMEGKSNRGTKIRRFLVQFGRAYGTFQNRKGLLFFFFCLSLVENLFPIAWSYILALAFQLQVSLLDCFVVVPSVLILRRLPISIDGIGIHQTAFVYLLSLTGVPGAHGLLLGIVTHLLATALVLPGGLFYMWRGIDIENI